jgi:hypothetical protein
MPYRKGAKAPSNAEKYNSLEDRLMDRKLLSELNVGAQRREGTQKKTQLFEGRLTDGKTLERVKCRSAKTRRTKRNAKGNTTRWKIDWRMLKLLSELNAEAQRGEGCKGTQREYNALGDRLTDGKTME